MVCFSWVAAKRILADDAVVQKDIDVRAGTEGRKRAAILRDKLKGIDIFGEVGN